MALSKESLLAKSLKRGEVELEDGVVVVRAVTRGEYQAASRPGDDGQIDIRRFEKGLITAGLVEPELAEHEVAEWMSTAAAGEVGKVFDKIMVLSGFRQGAPKSDA